MPKLSKTVKPLKTGNRLKHWIRKPSRWGEKEKAHLEKSEVIESVEMPYDELKSLAIKGEFRHGAGLAALCRAERFLS